jgi:hypothetical protein
LEADNDIPFILDLIDSLSLKVRGCGVGKINNKGEKAKGVVCTDLKLVDSAKCKKYGTASELHTVPATMACLQWDNKDNNL